MEIKINTAKNENGTLITLSGKINTLTAQELSKELDAVLSEATDLTIDMKDVDYISSAGLRLFVTAQKKTKMQNGSLTIKNMQDDVLDVFNMTGLTGVFHIIKD